MSELKEKIDASLGAIRRHGKGTCDIGIILGTGLGQLARQITQKKEIAYEEIPHFPTSTAPSHAGRLILGKVSGKNVIAMEGRFHYYEGYSLGEVTYPVRVMRRLGCKTLIVSNAAGALNPAFSLGDLMIMSDHINWMGVNPLVGPNEDWMGIRFPDMSEPYDRKLIRVAEEVALSMKLKIQKGVYVSVTGPNLETRAEYRMLRLLGADAVGMSTVPEVIVARHCGLRVLGISCITDLCLPDALEEADIERIIRVAKASEPKLTKLVMGVIEKL